MTLTTHHLSRRFGDRLAVDNASFSVERGRRTGFVGANGAGKTTVMRMILGVLAPSAGTVTLDGVELDQATRRLMKRSFAGKGVDPLAIDIRDAPHRSIQRKTVLFRIPRGLHR